MIKLQVLIDIMQFFFNKSWSIIQHDVVPAVKDFFVTGTMFKVVNCATITLIPKIYKPKTVKDFRPISCYTILCKLISKILANRLQKVMSYIINEAQTGLYLAENLVIMSY